MKTTIPRFGGRLGVSNFLKMKANPLQFLSEAHLRCGPNLRMQCGPFSVVSITHPEHVSQVLKTHSENFTKNTPGYKGMRDYLGRGLLTHQGGKDWKKNSKLLRPLFWHSRLEGATTNITNWVNTYKDELVVAAKNQQNIDLSNYFRRLTLSILCDLMFGFKDKHHILQASNDIDTCIHTAFAKLYDPFFLLNPKNILIAQEFRKARQRLREFSITLLEHKADNEQDPTLKPYMNDVLKAANTEQNQCKDEIITLLQAGHETSATALNALFLRILQSKPLQSEIYHAVDTLQSDQRYDVSRLDILNQVIWESLRFDPSTWAFDRYVENDFQFNETLRVRRGEFVVVSPYVIHRYFSDFSDPTNFNPKLNFADTKALKSRHYIPFSLGPRLCPGAHMAHLEIRETIIGIFKDFEFQSNNTDSLEFKPSITLKLNGSLKARPKARIRKLAADEVLV